MAIARPNPGDNVDALTFGQPVVDWINAATPTAWTNCTLTNNYTVQDGMTPQYRKVGDMVYVRGRCGGGSPGTAMFTLPTGFRHPTGVAYGVPGFDGSAWGFAIIDIQTGGAFVHAQGGSAKVSLIIQYATV